MEKLYNNFIFALKNNDKNTVLKILQGNPKFHNYVGEYGDLIQTITFNNKNLLKYAFKCGLSPDAGCKRTFQTFLQQGAASGNLKAVKLAIKYGANVDRKNIDGETAIGYACSWGQFEAVKFLIKAGAKINEIEKSPDGYCTTALDVCKKYPRIEKYLRKKGAKFYKELSKGRKKAEKGKL